MIPRLETERLRMREWRESDFEVYGPMMADAETVRYLSGAPVPVGDAWRQMAAMAGHWLLRGYGHWAIEEKSTGDFVGRVGLWNPAGWPGVEVGWTIARSRWGKGYAPEAGSVAMAYGFMTLAVDQLISVIHVDNLNSKRVAEKLGEHYLRDHMIGDVPCVIYGITRGEWKTRQTQAI